MKDKAIYRPSFQDSPLRQGEILTDIVQYNPVLSEELPKKVEAISFNKIIHPYVIVITQDCDLDWDYQARKSLNFEASKLLNSIILCEITIAKEVRHIKYKDIINSKTWNLVKTQRHERFYFFEEISEECDLENIGLPELTADFKKVFGIDSDTLYHQIEFSTAKRRTILSSPYLENFSQRYYSFHGRVALPFQHESEREG